MRSCGPTFSSFPLFLLMFALLRALLGIGLSLLTEFTLQDAGVASTRVYQTPFWVRQGAWVATSAISHQGNTGEF